MKGVDGVMAYMTIKRASKIVLDYYGFGNVIQIRKPYHKDFFIVDFANGTGAHLTKAELLELEGKRNV